jgi:ATP-dependent RNA helicase MSS116, mitochondrial
MQAVTRYARFPVIRTIFLGRVPYTTQAQPEPRLESKDPFERPAVTLYSTLEKPVKAKDNTEILDPAADAPGLVQARNKSNHFPFTALKGGIDYDTFKAITVKPFKHTHMTPVQHAVLTLLPELALPFGRDPPSRPDGTKTKTRSDLLVMAKTGTGKTLAFLVPAIESRLAAIRASSKQALIDAGLKSDKHLEGRAARVFSRTTVGTLIISPTRELATQIANEALRLAHHHDGFEVRLFVGGISKRMQLRDWMRGRRDIVVATPGRLRDLLTTEPSIATGISSATQVRSAYCNVLKCSMLTIVPQVILDEADTLLDMGFRSDLDAILEYLPKAPQRQTFLFSATLSPGVRQVARTFLRNDHVFINTIRDDDSPVHAHIPQFHTVLPSPEHQIPHLLRTIAHDQLTNPGKSKVIVFLPTTRMTQLFASLLREIKDQVLPAGRTRVYEMHSKKEQSARTTTSDGFRNDTSGATVLVTSDVSARGVDYPKITRVIQVGIPGSSEQYIHRVGRTGRAAAVGGRADIVVLPWEIGFFTWQLTNVPLQAVTVAEMKREVTALAEKHDGDTATSVAPRPVANSAKNLSSLLSTQMEETLKAALHRLDPEVVRETFASLLGYYIAKSPELRIGKNIIVEGLRLWATGAMGLPQPPHVSEAFLHRLGVSDGRTKRFGNAAAPQDGEFKARMGPRWTGRGQQRLKDRVVVPAWQTAANLPLDSNDPEPSEYRGNRYGRTGQSYKVPRPREQGGFYSGGGTRRSAQG